MSRRRRLPSSPIDSVAATLLLAQIVQVLRTLSEREAGAIRMRLGLTATGTPMPPNEIAKAYGITIERYRQIESKTFSKLRHPSRSQVLRDYLDAERVRPVPQAIRDEILGELSEWEPLAWCDRHGWTVPEGASGTCERCPCLISKPDVGRPRRYCSDACRKAASRARSRAGAQAGSAT
jgi:Sigma-70, region 4